MSLLLSNHQLKLRLPESEMGMMERPAKRRRRSRGDYHPFRDPFVQEVARVDIEQSFREFPRDRSPVRSHDYNAATHPFPTVANSRDPPIWEQKEVREFGPPIPKKGFTGSELNEPNPFEVEDGIPGEHPALLPRSVPITLPVETRVMNGFIKAIFYPDAEKRALSMQVAKESLLQSVYRMNAINKGSETEKEGRTTFTWRVKSPASAPRTSVPPLPPQFGDVKTSDKVERDLLTFYLKAICNGRTVVPEDNTFLVQITPIAQQSRLVFHAIISLAATYVLDFKPLETLKKRAAFHHKTAVSLLSKSLHDREYWAPGKAEHIMAALVLLCQNECVNWESEREAEQEPKWYKGAKLSEKILNMIDPCHKYHDSENVQCGRAFIQFANRVCQDLIFTDCVYPLDVDTTVRFRWLLEGNEIEQRRIVGFTGLSSKLMHTFEKITRLTTRLYKDPRSDIFHGCGAVLEEQLENFYQWTTLGDSYPTSEELLQLCKKELDEEGKVTTELRVTQLIAESYVAAAQIYIRCRLFRWPRNDPKVQDILHRLLKYVQRQPTIGWLFTAQTPMFAIYIGGLVAIEPEDRRVITDWYEAVCSGCRGNVPPAWKSTKLMWHWLDANIVDEDPLQLKPFHERKPWWELMVMEISRTTGRLSLA